MMIMMMMMILCVFAQRTGQLEGTEGSKVLKTLYNLVLVSSGGGGGMWW